MDKALTWFINCWATLIVVVNVVAVVGFFLGRTFWDGWKRLVEVYSPFNIANLIMELLVLSPALTAMYWRNKRRARRQTSD